MADQLLGIAPYMGTEPYLYFAFASADARRAARILDMLAARGFRVWYAIGTAGSAEALLRRSERALAASLTMVYLSDAAVGDHDLKSALLVNQKNGRPILCLDPDGTDRRLAMGLREDIPHLGLYGLRSENSLEEALIRADGVTQELLGEPVQARRSALAGRLAAVLSLLAVGMLLLTFVGGRFLARRAPTETDTLVFTDPVLLTAAREAVGGGALTEESTARVTRLRLTAVPDSWDDLGLMPSLEVLELPQSAAMQCDSFPDGVRILLTGGDGS